MFEQTLIAAAPAGRRIGGTMLGFAGQGILLGLAVIGPMMFPQVLPRAVLITGLVAPTPPPPLPPPGPRVQPRSTQVPNQFRPTSPFVIPTHMPAKAATIVDEPMPASPGGGVVGGTEGGDKNGVRGGFLLSDLIKPQTPAPEIPKTAVKPQVVAAVPETTRIVRMSKLDPARLVHKVEPTYPVLARQMHIGGTVELLGTVGIDGHMREVRVLSGHPLLIKAAIEAISQWIYQPPILNGQPVEIQAPITVTFRMN